MTFPTENTSNKDDWPAINDEWPTADFTLGEIPSGANTKVIHQSAVGASGSNAIPGVGKIHLDTDQAMPLIQPHNIIPEKNKRSSRIIFLADDEMNMEDTIPDINSETMSIAELLQQERKRRLQRERKKLIYSIIILTAATAVILFLILDSLMRKL